jgi:hypothetical protein
VTEPGRYHVDRAVDGGVWRHAVEEAELIKADSQDVRQRPVEGFDAATRERRDRVVQTKTPGKNAVDDSRRERAIGLSERGVVELSPELDVGARSPVDPLEHRERESARVHYGARAGEHGAGLRPGNNRSPRAPPPVDDRKNQRTIPSDTDARGDRLDVRVCNRE